jgi:hypothetical protein
VRYRRNCIVSAAHMAQVNVWMRLASTSSNGASSSLVRTDVDNLAGLGVMDGSGCRIAKEECEATEREST